MTEEVKEVAHGLDDEAEGSLELVEDAIECAEEEKDAEEQFSSIVKVKWNKFIKMKNRNFQDDYRILS